MAYTPGVTVGGLLGSRLESFGLSLELLAGGEGLDRPITSPHPQKTGLALAGFHNFLKPGRVLILGESEVRFLHSLTPDERSSTLGLTLACDIPCVLITAGSLPPPELVEQAGIAGVPLLRTTVATPSAVAKISSALEDTLAERTSVHAALLDVLGLGVLITGESGIGKSETALDLIARGHRLVADDTVEVRKRAERILVGTCPELTRHHMELRGLGIINVKDLFGIASTRSSKRIELVVQLERWDPSRQYERLGLDDAFYEILGLKIPLLSLPVTPGRNIAILVEVAARNQFLKAKGHNSARILAARLEAQLLDAPDEDEDASEDVESEDAGESP
jgi:HPr kinase/phosphorylase